MKIFVTETEVMDGEVKRMLSALGHVQWGPLQNDEFERALSDCEVLMVRLGLYIGPALMARAPRLRYIVTATTGLDHIDLEAAAAGGIRVVSLRDCPESIQEVSATAEHTIGLLLALLRRTPAAVDAVLAGGWERDRYWGTQLRGKRCGIIGYGRIGAMVAQCAAAFGMDVVAYDKVPAKVRSPARAVSFEELLTSSDVVSVHVTATPENCNLLNRGVVQQMKEGAVLVNTARGSIVDETALAEAVATGRLLGVATDVLDGEERGDLQSNPLLSCARAGHNVLITPHIGGATREAIRQTETAVVKHLATLLSPLPLQVSNSP